MENSYKSGLIETLAKKIIEQDGEIRNLKKTIYQLEKRLEEEQAKNVKFISLEKLFALQEG